MSLAQGSLEEDASNKRHSLDSSQMLNNTAGSLDSAPGLDFSQLKFPTLRRRASSGDLQEMASSSSSLDDLGGGGLGARLYRSSSIGNMRDLSNESLAGPSKDFSEGGFFGRLRRSPSIGSLTNLVQNSNISAGLPRATSLESFPTFKPGESPPSPSKFDQDGTNFFGRSLSSNNAPSSSADTLSGASGGSGFPIGTRLSGLAGVRGFWSQEGSRSVEISAPAPQQQQQQQPPQQMMTTVPWSCILSELHSIRSEDFKRTVNSCFYPFSPMTTCLFSSLSETMYESAVTASFTTRFSLECRRAHMVRTPPSSTN